MLLVDLFCGCGGASLGFALEGFEVVGAIDKDRDACETYARNFGLSPIRADIFSISPRDFANLLGLSPGQLDVLLACPPCQPFTTWAKTNGNPAIDKRRDLIPLVSKFVEVFLPKFVVFENIPRLRLSPWSVYFRMLLDKLENLGYVAQWKVVNAVHYGLPQRRRRLILVATRLRSLKRSSLVPRPMRYKQKTVRDAIADLPPLRAGERHSHIPNHVAPRLSLEKLQVVSLIPKNGGSLLDLPQEFWLPCQRRWGFRNAWARMRWNEPAPTITTRCTNPSSGRFLHPTQDRPITPREAARLQGFPDWFRFPENIVSAARLIGEAMPPPLAQRIAEHLIRLLDKV